MKQDNGNEIAVKKNKDIYLVSSIKTGAINCLDPGELAAFTLFRQAPGDQASMAKFLGRLGYQEKAAQKKSAAFYQKMADDGWLDTQDRVEKQPILQVVYFTITLDCNLRCPYCCQDLANRRMTAFSKGMKQKVLIIAGMIHNPEILFLDEPLAGLDANTNIIIKEILARLAASGKTIFYCSHIMDVVERICHRIVIIDKGATIADGPFEQLQSRASAKGESLEKIFTQLTGSSQYKAAADDFMAALEEKPK